MRLWASQIFHVAAEEMLHLAQAWNLLTAVGGSPYYSRPNFPQAAKHFPLEVALLLRRFDADTVQRFIYYESPAHERDDLPDLEPPPGALWPIDESFPYRSVGELYGECWWIIKNIGKEQLFIGEHDRQIGQDLIDFPNIVEVTNHASAQKAIKLITEQGEGTKRGERDTSHYGVFRRILENLRASPPDWEPSRPVADNPYWKRRRDQVAVIARDKFGKSGIRSEEITHERSREAVDLFDDVYVSMLQALAYVFSNATQEEAYLRLFSRSALDLMITVIRPLGEGISLMPSGTEGINAGPTFAMTRHAQLPSPPMVAHLVFYERLEQLYDHATTLAAQLGEISPLAVAHIRSAEANLARIAEYVASM